MHAIILTIFRCAIRCHYVDSHCYVTVTAIHHQNTFNFLKGELCTHSAMNVCSFLFPAPTTTILFSVSMHWINSDISKTGVIKYLSCCVWSISFNLRTLKHSSGSICQQVLHVKDWLIIPLQCISHLFIHSLFDRHLDCYSLLALLTKPAMSIGKTYLFKFLC